MKTFILAAVAIAAGTAVGVIHTWIDLRPVEASAPLNNVAQAEPQPRVEVLDELTHNFGVMNRNEELQKVWRFKNVGDAALSLKMGEVSCSLCVQCEIETPEVAPGEIGRVKVTWGPKVFKPNFQHGAEIHTDDPGRPVVRIQIVGRVTETVGLEPPDLSFSGLSSDAGAELTFSVYGYARDDLKVEFAGLKYEETSEFFDVRLEPLSADELADQEGAKSGYKGTVVVKPGLPVGSVAQTVQLTTNDDQLSAFDVPIRGVINSDISLIAKGASFRRENNLLSLGPVKQAQGAQAELSILVRGANRDEVELSIGETDPSLALSAKIGQPNRLDSVTMYPLTVEVPAGSPLVSRMGPGRSNLGRIVIETTHPDAKQVLLLVRYAVEN